MKIIEAAMMTYSYLHRPSILRLVGTVILVEFHRYHDNHHL